MKLKADSYWGLLRHEVPRNDKGGVPRNDKGGVPRNDKGGVIAVS